MENPCPFLNFNVEEVEQLLKLCAEVGIYARKEKPQPPTPERMEILGGVILKVSGSFLCPCPGQVQKISHWITKNKLKRVSPARANYDPELGAAYKAAYLAKRSKIEAFSDMAETCKNKKEFLELIHSEGKCMNVFFNLCVEMKWQQTAEELRIHRMHRKRTIVEIIEMNEEQEESQSYPIFNSDDAISQ